MAALATARPLAASAKRTVRRSARAGAAAAAPRAELKAHVSRAVEVARTSGVSVAGAALVNALAANPAMAKEAGKIFDFDLTLPLIAGQFLLLMIILDKTVYGPVGDVLDKRDNELKTKLEAVKDNSGELDSLMAQASKVVADARAEVQEKVNAAKKSAQEANAAKYSEAKAKMDKELATALASLKTAEESSASALEGEAETLSDFIVSKALPL